VFLSKKLTLGQMPRTKLFWRNSSIKKKDLKQIAERMVTKLAKKKESASAFESGIVVRKTGSVSSDGVSQRVKMTDCSPIKHLAEVRCIVSKPPQLTFRAVIIPFLHDSKSSHTK
jgi:hypothetical protein